MIKKYTFDNCENLLLKTFDDAQSGIETALARDVRLSLEAQNTESTASDNVSRGTFNDTVEQ